MGRGEAEGGKLSTMKTSKMKVSKLELRVIELGRFIKDGEFRLVILNGKPIPEVDIFLTEEEFVENANPEFQEFDYMITKELCRVLYSFGFLPRAGFLSDRIKLPPYRKTIAEAIGEKDVSLLLEDILVRKQTIYDAQRERLLSCKDDLEYIGVKNAIATSSFDLSQYQGWEPIYLLSQMNELKKLFFRVADRTIKGITYYKNKLVEFEMLIESSNVREESIQGFLKENTWIFGAEYIKVKPKMALSHNFVVDFLLQRFDRSWEVIELKLPTEDIFTSQMNITAKVTSAIGQIQKAQEFTVKNYEFLKTNENMEVFKPSGVLVIGNRLSNEERERLEVINKSYSDITIATYQDLLQKARKQVELIEKIFKHQGYRDMPIN